MPLWAVAAGLAPPQPPGRCPEASAPLWAEPGAPGLLPPFCPDASHPWAPGTLGRVALALLAAEGAGKQMLGYRLAFEKSLEGCGASSSWMLSFHPNDLETLTTRSVKKLISSPHFISIKDIKECGLNYFLGSSFSTFGLARCSFAFLRTKDSKRIK